MEAVPQTDAEAYFRRYRDIVPDWEGFVASLHRPLPATVWVHPERTDAGSVASLLAETGLAAEAVGWAAGALRLPSGAPVGSHWGFMAGLYQIQEEIAMLPARLLAPEPGERVLDLCAAPGNKTAQMALAMGHRGTLYANDIRRERLGALRQTIKRLGLRNVATTAHPGEEFPLACGPFDRVLVDAPCSGEGTWRKGGAAPRLPDGDAPREALVRRQQRMLERGLSLTRPGGRVVYATCTLSPDENEGVVDAVLRRWGDAVAVRRPGPELGGLVASSPVTHWRGRAFHVGVGDCLRFWPQDNDTGGFFVAVIDKHDGKSPRHESAEPLMRAAPERLARALGRFGVDPGVLGEAELLEPGGRYANLVPGDLAPARRPPPHALGLPALGVQAKPDKPTTALAMAVGPFATASVVAVDATGARRFLAREEAHAAAADAATPGYVLVSHRGFTIGVGRLRAGGRLESLYPGRWSRVAGRRGLVGPEAG